MKNGKANHTPGPWIIQDLESRGLFEVSSSTEGGHVAYVGYDWQGKPRPDWKAGAAVNAALIAAAPDLLAALYDCVTTLEEREQDENGEAALTTARAAIAKAEPK